MGVLLVGVIGVFIGIINILIEDSKSGITFVPFLLFILPSAYYFFLAKETKKVKYNTGFYTVISGIYLALCFVEFFMGYHLDEFMRNYLSRNESANTMSYVLQIVPWIYKIFRVSLVVIFIRVANLSYKYEKLKLHH